jgi:hypothetical protein
LKSNKVGELEGDLHEANALKGKMKMEATRLVSAIYEEASAR